MLASLQSAAAAAAAASSGCGSWPATTAAAALAALRVASSSSSSTFSVASTTSSSSSFTACRGLHTYGAPLSPEQQQQQRLPGEGPGGSGRIDNSSGGGSCRAGLPSPWGSSGSIGSGGGSGEGGAGLPGGFSEDPAACGHPKDKISLYRRALRRAIYYRKPKDQLAYCSFCKAVGGPHQQLQGTAACNGRCLVGAPQGKYPREYKQPC